MPASPAGGSGALDQLGRVVLVAVPQPGGDAIDVSLRSVLAHLDLGLDPCDDDLDADDRPELAGVEPFWSVVDAPGMLAAGLVTLREPPHQVVDPGGIVVYDEVAVHMKDRVVPRRHHPTVLGLARVPRR